MLCAGYVQGSKSTLHVFSPWGRRDVQGVQGVQGYFARAYVRICVGAWAGIKKCSLIFIPRARLITMHTLHTMHKRWGSKAESVQGLKTTLHIPCTELKTGEWR